MSDHLRLDRDELFSPAVDQALETRRLLVERAVPEAPEISPVRAFVMSPMVYLPVAGFLAALLSWLLFEPSMKDGIIIGGEVTLVQMDPFEGSGFEQIDFSVGKPIKFTVGRRSVMVFTGITELEPGTDGQPAFASWNEIPAGTPLEVVGVSGAEAEVPADMMAIAVRPATPARAAAAGQDVSGSAADWLLFPVTALLITVFLLLAEGLSSRNWTRAAERVFIGGLLTVVFAFLAYLPAGLILALGQAIATSGIEGMATSKEWPGWAFLTWTAARGGAWAAIGAGLGLGMNLVRTTKAQLRNSLIGGLLGGALGGIIFGALERILGTPSFFSQGDASRLFGLLAVGTCVGIFVALVERFAREAWLRVRTGPLAGKAFVLYKSPTVIGSAPQADIYLFKDAGIDPDHARVHRVGNRFEIENVSSRGETMVGGDLVRRRRLQAGDTIRLGDTVLEFEERALARGGDTEG